MTYTVAFHPRARKELLEAWIWYEEKQFGLGDRFENEGLQTHRRNTKKSGKIC